MRQPCPKSRRCRYAAVAALLWGFASLQLPAIAADEPDEIRTEAVSELPLPRDRTDFGIGEEVWCWIDRPATRRPVVAGKELAEYLVWTAADSSTMLPVVTRRGDRSVLKIALSDRDGQISIGAETLDLAKSCRDRPEDWQPAREPATLPTDSKQTPTEEAVAEWQRRLNWFESLRAGRQTPVDEVEHAARVLFSEPLTEREQAQACFQLAELYAQSGMQHPERVLEYSRRALALPLEPLERTTLAIYRGDACLARNTQESFVARRRAAAWEYFLGLAEIARHDLPAEPPESKLEMLIDEAEIGPNGEEAEEVRQQREIRAHNARADFQTALLLHRQLLGQQLKSLYFPE